MHPSHVTILSAHGSLPGYGDIFVNDAVSWTAPTTLTLQAHRNIWFNSDGIARALTATAGSLDLRAGVNNVGITGGIAQNIGTISVGGLTTLAATAGAGDILLDNALNNLRSVTVNSGRDVRLRSTHAGGVTIELPQSAGGLRHVTIDYGNATRVDVGKPWGHQPVQLSGNLAVTSGGAIVHAPFSWLDLTGALAASSFTAGGDVTLNHGSNNLGAVTVNPTLATANVNLRNNSLNAGLNLTATVTDLTLTQPNGSFTLAADNRVTGSLNVNTSGGAAGSNITVGAQNMTGTMELYSDGSIVQGGAWSTGGAITFATPNPMMLGHNITTTNDAITFPTAVTLANNVTIDTGRAPGGSISFNSTINGGRNLSLLAGSGSSVTLSGVVGGSAPLTSLTASANSVTAQAVTTTGNQTWEGNALTLNGNLTGTGTMTLRPYSAGTSIGIAGGAGTLSLSTALLGRIQPGFSNWVIGRTDGTGDITQVPDSKRKS